MLYFANLSRDREDEYFRAGMTEDIITELAKIKELRIFPRSAVLPFRDNPLTVAQISQRLAVAYVLDGSIRRAGNRYFADLAVGLARTVTFQRSEQTVSAVTDAVRKILPGADVTVQPLPRAQRSENIFDRIRAVATRHNLNVHDISVQDLAGALHVEQHVELDERMTLKTAHDQVTELEADMRREVPEIADILTHIESEPATIETGDEMVRDADLERRLKVVAARFPEIIDMHDIQIKKVRGRLYVSCHCTLSDDLPLARVHDIQTELEIYFKQDAPELFRVLIHPEPSTDNRR